MPLGQPASGDPGGECWSERIGDAVKGLFLLARATAADLESAAGAGGSCLIAATAMGGRFAGGGTGPRPVSSRVMAASPGWSRRSPGSGRRSAAGPWTCAGRPGGHAGRPAGRRGVRRRRLGGGRLRPRPSDPAPDRREPAVAYARPPIELAPGEPVVITGGARGITALVAAELARAWRPTLLIVGTTPEPAGPEPDRHRRARRRGRDQGGAARAAPPRGPSGRPRRDRGRATSRCAVPARSARTWTILRRAGATRRVRPRRRPRPGGHGRRPRRLARPLRRPGRA